MNPDIRNNVWQRDKGLCQRCQKPLYFLERVDPFEGILEEFSSLTDIPIYRWLRECWRCHKETAVVTYYFAVAYDYHIGDIEKIDQELMRQYIFVKKVFSNTMDKEVIANTCVNCGALQGNWFIGMDVLEMLAAGLDMNKLIEKRLENTLELKDFPFDKKEFAPYHVEIRLTANVHHIDINPKNDDLQNLVLVCRACHLEVHSEIRKRTA